MGGSFTTKLFLVLTRLKMLRKPILAELMALCGAKLTRKPLALLGQEIMHLPLQAFTQ